MKRVGGGVRRLRRHSTIVTHPPRKTIVVLRPRPRPTAAATPVLRTGTTQRAVRQVDPYAVTEIPCVCAPTQSTGTLVSAVHSQSRNAPTRRRRPWTYRWDGERVVCFGRVGGRVDAADDFPDDEARARAPDFSLSHRRRNRRSMARKRCWYSLALSHVLTILFYARKPFDKNIIYNSLVADSLS